MEIKHLGQLLHHLAKKAGVKEDDQFLKDILANTELSKVNVPQELVSALDENLLHIEAALDQHPRVRSKYMAEILNPFDARLTTLLDEFGFADAEKDEMKGIKSTYKRFEAIAGKLKELTDKKAGATNDKDKQALQTQIDGLQTELRKAKEGVESAKAEYEKKLQDDRKEFRLTSLLSGKKTTLDQLPADVRNATLLGIVNKKLQAENAELRFDEQGNLHPFKNDGSKLYGANHTVITLDALIDSELAQNKVLVVSQPTDPKNGQQQSPQPPGGNPQPGGSSRVPGQDPNKITGTNQSVVDMNLEAIAALEAQATA